MSQPEENQSDMRDHIQHCVLDSGPIIKGLIQFCSKINVDKYYAVPDVIREIRDAQSRQQLSQLPFELIVKQPTEEALAAGNDIHLHFEANINVD